MTPAKTEDTQLPAVKPYRIISIALRQRYQLVVEAVSFGLAYGAGLWWASVCLLASFRPSGLSAPYWNEISGLRTDTSGIIAFFAVAVFLTVSESLRLRRRYAVAVVPDKAAVADLLSTATMAVSEVIGLLATGIVIYLSVNAVTHPETLNIQATHLAPWPTEGTLRVIAILLCVCSAAFFRFLRASTTAAFRDV
jgi:hypothetical protein